MRKHNWHKKLFAALLAITFILTVYPQMAMADSEKISIGLSIPITGALAQSGEQALNAAEIACREINAEGGINGKEVEYVVLDDKNDSTEAAMCAQRFIENDEIVAVIGSLTSGTTLAVTPIYEAAGMPVVCPTGNNDELSNYSNFIRIVMAASKEAPMVGAMVMNNLGASKVGIIYDNSDYGNTMVSASSEIVEKLGGEIVASEAYTAGTDKDFSVQLSKMLQMETDAIIIVGDYNEGSLIISQAETMGGFEDIKWAGDSYLLGDVLLERVGDSPLAENIYAACDYNPFSESENHKRFSDTYQEEYGLIPSEPAGFTYDAFMVIFDALKEGASKENLVSTIKSLEFTDLVCSDYVMFDDAGNRMGSGNEIVVIKDGEFAPLGENVDTAGIEE